MPLKHILRNFTVAGLVLTVAITGCTSFQQVKMRQIKPSSPEMLSSEEYGWWYARFRMNWPQDTEARWYMDLFVAHQIILPVLNKFENDIYLWRFHRRAARDKAGHQFSFIFYASPSTAYNIYQNLSNDTLLTEIKFAGLIIEDIYDDPSFVSKPNIEDTSDKNWSSPIQEAWPYYIMGVSQMWLNLIRDIADDHANGSMPATIAEIEEFYQAVNTSLTELWEKEGRHAFLHHLNALFGYEPLVVYEKRLLKF